MKFSIYNFMKSYTINFTRAIRAKKNPAQESPGGIFRFSHAYQAIGRRKAPPEFGVEVENWMSDRREKKSATQDAPLIPVTTLGD
ncbi:hypothetical protein D3C87_1735100 [compost metagenome]